MKIMGDVFDLVIFRSVLEAKIFLNLGEWCTREGLF
jgi:hypothetical protein